MSRKICINANYLSTEFQPGHHWVFFNWASGLADLGFDVVWLEVASSGCTGTDLEARIMLLRADMEYLKLQPLLVVLNHDGLSAVSMPGLGALDDLRDSELLVNFQYSAPSDVVSFFKKTALIDIDPGVLQGWLAMGAAVAAHDLYFTIGHLPRIKELGAPMAAIKWMQTRPCISLNLWRKEAQRSSAAFSTVANWWASGGTGLDHSRETKAFAFEPYIDLPSKTHEKLEIATCLSSNGWEGEVKDRLLRKGWIILDSQQACPTLGKYKGYIAASKAEFSCAKPAYVDLKTGWISDRTLCYLASGRPAVIQDTGPSVLFTHGEGVFRFSTPSQALDCLHAVSEDYSRQCELARRLVEQNFDAKNVISTFMESAL